MTATAFATDPLLDDSATGALTDSSVRPLQVVSESTGSPVLAPVIPLGQRHQVEVYRRRRFIAAVVATIAILVACQLSGVSLLSFESFGQVDGGSQVDAAPYVHVVRPGDSYGAIAATVGADSPAVFADALRQANGGADLVVGQRVFVDVDRINAGRLSASS